MPEKASGVPAATSNREIHAAPTGDLPVGAVAVNLGGAEQERYDHQDIRRIARWLARPNQVARFCRRSIARVISSPMKYAPIGAVHHPYMNARQET